MAAFFQKPHHPVQNPVSSIAAQLLLSKWGCAPKEDHG